jgi:hypothetical protein
MLERTRITPGNSIPTIANSIVSPEVFFQRAGLRVAPDMKARQVNLPAASVTMKSNGTAIVIPSEVF